MIEENGRLILIELKCPRVQFYLLLGIYPLGPFLFNGIHYTRRQKNVT